MKNFNGWLIQKTITEGTEIYFNESFLGIKHEHGTVQDLPGKKIYTVTDIDEINNTITLIDNDGKQYTFLHDDLVNALSESSKMSGFQTLQYPVGYTIATSGTALANLSIFDPRLKKI